MKAKPFVKWAGGKRQLIKVLDSNLPDMSRIKSYAEPFLGGGAMFFHMAQKYQSIKAFWLSEKNETLFYTWLSVQTEVNDLIGFLKVFSDEFHSISKKRRKDFYYLFRDVFNESREKQLSPIKFTEMIAIFIFLNKTCFNGLWRVNKSGKFNVPSGTYTQPKICDEINLRLSSDLLIRKNISYSLGNFDAFGEIFDDETFVYFDPPYRPVSQTSSFTSYTKSGFNDENQIQLAHFYREMDKKGAKLMLSNSDDPFFDELYDGYRIERIQANRAINSNGKKRGKVGEILVMNY